MTTSPITPSASSASTSASESPRMRVSTSRLCSPSSGACAAVVRARSGGVTEGRPDEVGGSGDRMLDRFEQPTPHHLLDRSCSCAGTTGSAGNAGAGQGVARSRRCARDAHHAAMVASSSSSTARRPSTVASAGSDRHPGVPNVSANAIHCSSSPTEMATQRSCLPSQLDVRGAVDALRDTGRAAVPPALEQPAVRRVLDDQLGGEVERRAHHRALEEHAAAGAITVRQREQQGDGGVRAAHRVGDPRGGLGPAVGEPAHPGDAGLGLDGRRVGQSLAPRPGRSRTPARAARPAAGCGRPARPDRGRAARARGD